MKILIAADLHWPTINGVATFSRNLARGLAARGHEVVVIAPSQTGKSYEEYDGNYLIKRTMSVPLPFYQNFRISLTPQREVRRIIKDFQPDIIHIQMALFIGYAVRTYGLKYDIPIVATNHAMPENLLDNLWLLAPLSRPIAFLMKEYGSRFHSKFDYVTMPTEAAMSMFGDTKMPAKMEAVSNGIDLSRFTPTSPDPSIYETYNIPTDKQIVSYVGRVDAEKHIDVLIRAFATIADNTKHLLVVGSGVEAEELKALANELGLEGAVTFTGRVSDEDLAELHKVGDVYCMPSPVELQCIAMLEAMASGKPVVAVDAGALKELCQDGVNGILCEKDNVEEIAAAIKKILADEKLRKVYGKKSLEIAKTHDITHTLDRFEEIYTSVLAERSRE